MKKIIMVLMITLLLTGCSAKRIKDEQDNKVKEYLTKEELKEVMSNNDYIIVDVRTPLEYKEKHVVDAINIPYGEVTNDVSLFKNKIVLLYCKSGKRANMAYESLYALGYTVYNLGGIEDIDLPMETASTTK